MELEIGKNYKLNIPLAFFYHGINEVNAFFDKDAGYFTESKEGTIFLVLTKTDTLIGEIEYKILADGKLYFIQFEPVQTEYMLRINQLELIV